MKDKTWEKKEQESFSVKKAKGHKISFGEDNKARASLSSVE